MPRQVVQVSADCDDPAIAGRTGVLDGSYTGEGTVGSRLIWRPSFVIVDDIGQY